ncbi:hypothetical protein ABK249_11995 [Neorhizobium sp. Rsf11]|uniref:Uncharacterized protein n=1 Tax=Neorhizobium phenanthreniclasticum TaxID=3157917 RepID=A0ABV0M1D7_9HYPH
MTISAEVLDAMLAAGCTAEQIVAAVKADAAAVEARREAKRAGNAERQRRFRRNKSNALQGVTGRDSCDTPSSPEGSSPTPPSPKPLQSIPPSPPKGGSSPADFDRFWETYPHKIGKPRAIKAFAAARKRADLETILDGLRRYVAKTDDRPWCNPATWLSEDRWDDLPAKPPDKPPPKPNSVSHLSKFHTREDYLRSELERSEKSFKT